MTSYMRDSSQVLLEPKAQRWRLVALFDGGEESLVYLGSSVTQVRDNYQEAWEYLFEPSVRSRVKKMVLQKWVGSADRGWWQNQSDSIMGRTATTTKTEGSPHADRAAS